ncbi:MAG TPA: hypothetical protein VFL57_21510 [Bryobacteraceae bacterium]|nr:hypothetical protein [Bryobacteraceae bacterium]
MRRLGVAFAVLGLAAMLAPASRSDYVSVRRKFDSIEQYRYKPGTRVPIGVNELNAYVETELPKYAPPGVRAPHVELHGNNQATGYAKINFLTVRRAQGKPPNWFLRQLLDGERDVAVTTELQSGNGTATVFLRRVEIDGIPIQGAALDWVIRNYVLPNYPDAKIGRPIQLKYGMERFDILRNRVDVVLAAELRR